MTQRTFPSILFNAVFNNFWLKLIALLFALGFYAFIHSAQNAQRTVAIKLVVAKPPEDLPRRLMTDIPPTVNVTLIGPGQQLESLRGDAHAITLDLQAALDAELQMVPEMISPDFPPSLRVDRISPSFLKIRFQNIVTRQVTVEMVQTGDPAPGTELLDSVHLDPQRVTATGIESAMRSLRVVRTDAFDLSGLKEGRHDRILKLDPAPDNVTYNVDTVLAMVDIARRLQSRTFDGIKVEVVGLPLGITMPPKVQVVVTGPPERVAALSRSDVVPRVEPKAAEGVDTSQTGSATLPILIEIPDMKIEVRPRRILVKW